MPIACSACDDVRTTKPWALNPKPQTQHDPFSNGKLGPPFSVLPDDLDNLFPPPRYSVELLAKENRMSEEPVWQKRGCNYFFEAVYLVTKLR
jgi:hypothetical protein